MSNLKTKVGDLDVGKLKAVPVDLKKLGNAVNNEVVKNSKFNTLNTKVNRLEKNPDVTKLIHKNHTNLDKIIGDFGKEIPRTNGLVSTTVLNTKISKAENKIPSISNLVATTVLNTNISEVENKI